MKSFNGYRVGATLALLLLSATAYQDNDNLDVFDIGFSGNCSNGNCEEGDSHNGEKCPDDSILDPLENVCVCKSTNCHNPPCPLPGKLVLTRKGIGAPGLCCDAYQCISQPERNCSEVVCLEEGEKCPEDSYRLPLSFGDCCSTPQSCQCLPKCDNRTCPTGQHPVIVRSGNNKPGTCCPLFDCVFEKQTNDSCVVNGSKLMPNGSIWQKDPCIYCSCINGYQFCKASPSGSCNENKGCISSSKHLYEDGDTWEDDPCTQCKCELGEAKCVAYMCEVSCAHPRHVQGECCPQCDASAVVRPPPHCPQLNCSLRCLHGFVRDEAGCITCECEDGPCLLECSNGFARDTRGHLLCECAEPEISSTTALDSLHCPSALECMKFCSQGPDYNQRDCELCSCRNNSCEPLGHCQELCPEGFAFDEKGCPTCKCHLGTEVFLPEEKEARNCASSDGRVRMEGEVWRDGCHQCLCFDGTEMCNLVICPRLNCVNPVSVSSEDCCPTCPDDASTEITDDNSVLCHFFNGTYRKEGEMWYVNHCMKCLCHKGRTFCATRRCPPAPCPYPVTVEDHCCPYCPPSQRPEESYGKDCGFSHSHGSTWRRGNCESCKCDNGREICYSQQCDLKMCLSPILEKNQCCGTCIEKSITEPCQTGNKTHDNSAEWMEEDCIRCRCEEGRRMCTKEVCTPGNCNYEAKKEGSCCPFCREKKSRETVFGENASKISICKIVITILVLVIAALLVFIFVLCKRSRRYCVSCPDSERLPSFKTLSKPSFKYNSSDSDYTTEKEKFAIV